MLTYHNQYDQKTLQEQKNIHVLNISIKKNKTLTAARIDLHTSRAAVQCCTNWAMSVVWRICQQRYLKKQVLGRDHRWLWVLCRWMSRYIIQFGIRRGYPNSWIIAYLSLTTKFMRGYPHRDLAWMYRHMTIHTGVREL